MARPPITNAYPLPDPDHLRGMAHVAVAELGGGLVGAVAVERSEWNRRLVVDPLYVAAGARGRGVGRALLASAIEFARARRARCLWVETQNINYAAVQFYQRCGFTFVGLDERSVRPGRRLCGGRDGDLFRARPGGDPVHELRKTGRGSQANGSQIED